MKRFKVIKSGYYSEDESFVEGETKGVFNNEEQAIKLLKTLDDDWHYITLEQKEHIADGIYDWFTDESYGVDGVKYLSDFSEKELA